MEVVAQRRPVSPRLIDRPAERRHPPCLGAETPAGSCRRSVRVHQPWLSAPRVSLAANLVVRHSTPNSLARRSRPPSPEHARAHGSGEAAATAQCRPARVKPFADLLLRPSHHRTDFQPPCARPWPRRHAPVSNPSIPVEAALHDQANELVQGQIVKIYLAGQGTDRVGILPRSSKVYYYHIVRTWLGWPQILRILGADPLSECGAGQFICRWHTGRRE